MKRRFGIFLMAVSMALFGSMAFAGDDWQDGFAKALDENNLTGAMILAYNSQASPQAVHEALEAFGVEQEEVNQSFMLAQAAGNPCDMVCAFYNLYCCDGSPCEPPPGLCADAEGPPCFCTCSE